MASRCVYKHLKGSVNISVFPQHSLFFSPTLLLVFTNFPFVCFFLVYLFVHLFVLLKMYSSAVNRHTRMTREEQLRSRSSPPPPPPPPPPFSSVRSMFLTPSLSPAEIQPMRVCILAICLHLSLSFSLSALWSSVCVSSPWAQAARWTAKGTELKKNILMLFLVGCDWLCTKKKEMKRHSCGLWYVHTKRASISFSALQEGNTDTHTNTHYVRFASVENYAQKKKSHARFCPLTYTSIYTRVKAADTRRRSTVLS